MHVEKTYITFYTYLEITDKITHAVNLIVVNYLIVLGVYVLVCFDQKYTQKLFNKKRPLSYQPRLFEIYTEISTHKYM